MPFKHSLLYRKLISEVRVPRHILDTLALLTSLRDNLLCWINFHIDLIKGEISTPVVFDNVFDDCFEQVSRHGGWTSIGKTGDRTVVRWSRGGVVRLCGGITGCQRQTNGKGRAIVGGKEQGNGLVIFFVCAASRWDGKKKKKIPQNKRWRDMGTKTRCRHTTYLQGS